MNIIFVCPKCGHDLESGQLVSDPPIPTMRCQKCGFQWAGRLDFEEGELRVPLSPPSTYDWNASGEFVPECCRDCDNHPDNGGSGMCICSLPYFSGEGVKFS